MLETTNININNEKDLDIFFNPMMQGMTPFASSVDSSRLNMAAKYLNQTIPTENADNPIVVTPEIHKVTTTDDHFKWIAHEDTIVIYHGNDVLIVYLKESKEIKTLYVPQYIDAANVSYKLYYIAERGAVNKGELIYSYAPIDKDSMIPKLGYRVKTLFAPFFGFTTEDSYVVSESFAKRARHVYHEKIFIPISHQLKYYKRFEQWIPQIGDKINVKDGIIAYQPVEQAKTLLDTLSNISDKESKIFSKKIGPRREAIVTNVKIHKFIKDDEKIPFHNQSLYEELDQRYKTHYSQVKQELYEILSKIIHNESIVNTILEGVVDTHVFMHKLPKSSLPNKFKQYLDNMDIKEIDYVIEIDVAASYKTQLGDKFTSMYAGKGTVGLIVPDELMPRDENGNIYDIIVNPLGIFGRNNWGIIFEAHLGKIVSDIEQDIKDDKKDIVFRKINFVVKNFILKENPQMETEYKNVLMRLQYDSNFWDVFRQNVLEHGLFLYGRAFSNLTYTDFISIINKYEKLFNVNLTFKNTITYNKKLFAWLKELGLHSSAFSLPNEDVAIEAFTGVNYYMKLYHTAESKYNMANITGKYTYSGQPVRGRRNQGGTHASWQTLSALLASGATDVLKELFTVKADSLSEKVPFMADMIRGKHYLKNKYHSKTKTTIDINLRMLGLKFKEK